MYKIIGYEGYRSKNSLINCGAGVMVQRNVNTDFLLNDGGTVRIYNTVSKLGTLPFTKKQYDELFKNSCVKITTNIEITDDEYNQNELYILELPRHMADREPYII